MKTSLILGLALSSLVTTLSATPIALFNTGANGSGADPNYTVTYSNDPSVATNTSALAMTNPNAGWAAPLAGSKWINTTGNGNTSYCSNCSYAFSTTFDLTGLNPLSAVINGQVLADDHVLIYLNNTMVSSWTGNYSQATNFTVGSQYSSAFQSGINTLSFVVGNSGGPMGLDAILTGTANASAVPEPSAIGLATIAGALLVGVGSYKRRSAQKLSEPELT